MGWADRLVEMYKSNEAPEKYFYWSALATISAVIKKQVYLDRYQYKLYANIFALLVGKSGIKKGLPIFVCKQLIEKVDNTRIISGRKSVEKILQDLGRAYTLQNGTVISTAQGILISGELAGFLVKNPDSLTILTDIYDTDKYEEFWENSLKSGVDKLKNPCLVLFGATNEEHFPEAISGNDVKGGFVARTFIVLGTERGTLNSLTDPPSMLPDLNILADYLKEISKVTGQFKWTKKGKDLYNNWYYPFYSQKLHDPTGSFNRLGDQILKAAMLISLSDDTSLELKETHIFEAITVCEQCMNCMTQVTMSNGTHNLAVATKIILRELILHPNHQISKSDILTKYIGQLDSFDLTRIAESLSASHAIEVIHQGSNEIYRMRREAFEMYSNFRKQVQ